MYFLEAPIFNGEDDVKKTVLTKAKYSRLITVQ